jgi:formate hydrogenlyase subunit 4
MSVGDIVRAQQNVWDWFVFQNPLAAAILIIALIAEVNRSPFDLPEAEQELTAGFMTEYSGMKFATFMMAEYLGMIAVSMIAMSMFFGGYNLVLVDQAPILGPLILIGKVVACLIGFVWIRATLPRIRYDRLMMFGWKVMLPLALLAVAWTAVSMLIGDLFGNPVAYGIIAGVVFAVFLIGGIMVFRRMAAESAESSVPGTEDIDPVISGEPRTVGQLGAEVVGALLAIPFGLYALLIGSLKSMQKMGETPAEAEQSKAIQPAGSDTKTPAKGSGSD